MIKCHYKSVRMGLIKFKNATQSVSRDREYQELSHMSGESVNCYKHFETI